MKYFVVVFGIGLSLIGCDNSSSSNKVLTPTEFQTQLAEASCLGGVACGLVTTSELAACKAKATATVQAVAAYDATKAVADGRVSFNSTNAKACIAAAKNPPSCSASYQLLGTDCLNILVPLVANGGACTSSQECTSGTCVGASNEGCPGTCLMPLTTGSECDPQDSKCASTDRCAAADGATTGTCTKLKDLEEPCETATECKLEYWCHGTSLDPTDRKCRPPGKIGDPCEPFFFGILHDCKPELSCDVSGKQPVCKALVAASGKCTDGYDCVPGSTCVGLAFDENDGSLTSEGTCQAWLAPGDACDPTQDYNNCPIDYPCDADSSTCKEKGGLGSVCSANGCRSAYFCNNDLKCAVRPAFGAACVAPSADSEEPCAAGDCTGGFCTLSCE